MNEKEEHGRHQSTRVADSRSCGGNPTHEAVRKNPEKDPPGILDWISDFFVKPLKDAITGIVSTFKDTVTAGDFSKPAADSAAAADRAKAALDKLLKPKSPITPEEALARIGTFWDDVDREFEDLMGRTIAAELIGLGIIDVPAGLLSRQPKVAALLSMGEKAYASVWETSILPFLRMYYLSQFVPMIPPWHDLTTMVVREVIKPEDYFSLMPLHGFSGTWAKNYWEMHWILLPLGEVKDARRRGHIGDEELKTFLVLHDYKPEPRPGIKTSDRDLAAKLIWDLPGRIDSRWMFRWGKTDRDGLKDLLIKGGLDPAYADAVTDATAMNQFLREIRMQETNIKADLRDGYIDEETARADLKEIGYPPEFVEYHIADALKDRERTHKKELLTHYRDCFLADIPTTPPFEDAVRAILVVKEAADLFIERAYVKKLGKTKAG